MLEQTLTGHYFLRGLKLLWHPKLRLFTLLPILINTLVFIVLFAIAKHYYAELVTWLLGHVPHWLLWLKWLLWIIFMLAIIVIFAYTFTIITNIIGAPFNGLLAEKVEALIGSPPPSANMTFTQTLAATPRNIGRALKSLLYFIPRALLCLILLFIPLLQSLAPVAWFVLSAWMMSVQYMDYPMDNHHISFHSMLQMLHQKRVANFSFGSTVLLATMIPILNLVVMPAAVIGATLFWCERYQR